jgi:uncharacterized protein YraI
MMSRWKAIIVSASLLGFMSSAAAAFEAYLPQNTNMRWGPSTEFPAMVTVPAGSYVEVADCSEEWCKTVWGEYEGFIYRPLLAIAGAVTVPYVASYPDYEYYQGYYYGPTFVFQYYGGNFHSRRSSRAVMHSRAESRAVHHSRSDSRASHRRGDSLASRHSRPESRDARAENRRRAVPEAVQRQRQEARRGELGGRRDRDEARKIEKRRENVQERREERRENVRDRRQEQREAVQRLQPRRELTEGRRDRREQRAIEQRQREPRAQQQRSQQPVAQRQRAAPQRQARPPQAIQQRAVQRQARPPQVRQQRQARPAREVRQRAAPQVRQERSRPSGGNSERRRRD